LRARGLPPSLAAAAVLVGGLATVAAVLAAVINAFINGFADLADQVSAAIEKIRGWLASGPLHVSQDQIASALAAAQKAIANNQGALTSGALSTAATLTEVLAGFFLVLFSTFFFLKDGAKIWAFLT